MSNATLFSGVLGLEQFYSTRPRENTGQFVRNLQRVERARHFFRYAFAAYVRTSHWHSPPSSLSSPFPPHF
jgi:hypothetical protein